MDLQPQFSQLHQLQIVGESRLWFPFTPKREEAPLGPSVAQSLISGPSTPRHHAWGADEGTRLLFPV